jgi:two-component system, chemotaxis family, chemotaxis protein CheY
MKVLVVDDSKAMRMIVIRTLRQSGVEISEIREAEDGAEGLAAIADYAPDLVLSDWNMPNMTGIEFLTALRASGNTTMFGFVTSESGAAMREQALAAGASFLLVKPFNGERFAEVIGGTVIGGTVIGGTVIGSTVG